MNKWTDITRMLPPMRSGDELDAALTILPQYDEAIRQESAAARLTALSDLYRIYLPSDMSREIYSKLYLALLRSMQKKTTKLAVRQQYQNRRGICGQEYTGLLGGSDSFTIIGTSGIGKSSAISRAIDLIMADSVITLSEPYTVIIPCVVIQCPFDSSVKGMLLEILRKVDECLDTSYYSSAVKTRATTDMLIGSVSTVALNHIGLLIVDEIQNVASSKNGKSLIGALTQLINNSGISICMVGTPESAVYFEQAMQLARRTLGLQYGQREYDQYFHDFCCTVYAYQYVRQKTEITPAVIEWLYEHSAGVISVVISLIHDAQEIAILSGREILNLETLEEAYRTRLALLHTHIKPSVKKKAAASSKKACSIDQDDEMMTELTEEDFSIAQLVSVARAGQTNIVELLRAYIPVEEVPV